MMLTNTSQLYIEKSIYEFSIIVPVYNNQEKIREVIESIRTVLGPSTGNYEIIVVDDGSTDDTLSILQVEQQSDPNIRVLSYPQNVGKGFAVKTGILSCQGAHCIFIDGDLDVSASGLMEYLTELAHWDMVVGSKRHSLSRVAGSRSRKLLSVGFSVLVRLATGISVKDTQTGLKGGNSSALKRIFASMTTSRYAFDVELLMLATKHGLTIKEMPVNITLENRFKIVEIVRMLADVLRISYRYRVQNRMLVDMQ